MAIDEVIEQINMLNKKGVALADKGKYDTAFEEKDLEDVYLKKDKFVFFEVANEILSESIGLFFKVKRKTKERLILITMLSQEPILGML